MHVLVTCKNQNEGARVATTFLPLYCLYGFFSRRSSAANSVVRGRIWQNFELIRDFMHVLVSCKSEDPIDNEGTRKVTTVYIDFSNAQWQLTPKSVVGSSRNSKSSKLLCMSSLPARTKKIQSKMKALEWPQHLSH